MPIKNYTTKVPAVQTFGESKASSPRTERERS